MGASRTILTTLRDSLSTHIGDSKITYELFRELPQKLEGRSEIKAAGRIALYYAPENVSTSTGAQRAADSTQTLRIDISIPRGYRGKKAESGELPALDLRDKIVDWVRSVDVHATTKGYMFSLGFTGSMEPFRLEKYVTITLQFTGLRDLIITQA